MVGIAIFLLILFVLVPAIIFGRLTHYLYTDHLHDKPEYDEALGNFPFYATLDETLRMKFRSRLGRFIKVHEFEGRKGMVVTDETRILISAAAIHVTFGLDDYLFSSFKRILVYPDIYYSKFSRSFNKGETNPKGIIAFSWPHVTEGFATVNDCINLAYHEFAHALILESVGRGIGDNMFRGGYATFNYELRHERLSQHVREQNILRDYAFTNKMEFFAVSVEFFLESPHEMSEKCPRLYSIMKRMLRQDPVNNTYGLRFHYSDEFYDYYS